MEAPPGAKEGGASSLARRERLRPRERPVWKRELPGKAYATARGYRHEGGVLRTQRVWRISISLVLVSSMFAIALGAPGVASGATKLAEVELLGPATIRPDGALRVRVLARCQAPLVVQELSLEVSQDSLGGSPSGDFGIVCDGRWDRLKLTIQPRFGTFVGGSAQALAYFTVLDPDSF